MIHSALTKKNVLALCAMALIPMLSCNNDHQNDSKEIAEEHNEAKFEDRHQEKDAQFLVDAANMNLEEIKLAQLAAQKATMKEVKDLAKMMEQEHTKSLGELQALATKKSITLPASIDEKGNDTYKKLDEKSGHNFDKEYCDKMVDKHKDAIDRFEKAATDCQDGDIKAWASATLPALRTHLDHALMCQKNCEKM